MSYPALDERIASRPPGTWGLRRARSGAEAFLSRFGLLLGFLLLWQLAATQGWVNPSIFPPLDQIAAALWKGIVGGALLDDIAISLQRSGIAFLAAVAIGIPLGLLMGQLRPVERALDPDPATVPSDLGSGSVSGLHPASGARRAVQGLRDLLGHAVPDPSGDHRRREGGGPQAG
jgi:hypothetical protein